MGHDHAHVSASLDKQPDQVRTFVSGNAAAHTYQYLFTSQHKRIVGLYLWWLRLTEIHLVIDEFIQSNDSRVRHLFVVLADFNLFAVFKYLLQVVSG